VQLPARPAGALPGRHAAFLINGPVYSQLVQHGFRRSGTYTYRPLCDDCRACVPLRVLPNNSRQTARSARLGATRPSEDQPPTPAGQPEYYDLYQRYQRTRHPGGGMDNDDRESYQNFLLQSHVDSLLVEFREGGVLRMVSVIDLLSDGLSSVYTFYEPDLPRACFGIYNVLWQIELCRKLDLDFVYLGYWIEHSRKMAYKTGYSRTRPDRRRLAATRQRIAITAKNRITKDLRKYPEMYSLLRPALFRLTRKPLTTSRSAG